MQHIEITEHDFDALMDKLEKIEMENDGYIPSEEDVFDYIEKIQKDITCICFGTANISQSLRQRKKKRF